jgi:2-oxoglutarate ferredoxin oxidoreductase subunit alpha
MTEAVGLAAITETPMVIINAQRPGPATGLPTRTAQGDLHFMIHASQDEFPRFIFAPGDPQQAYYTTARALHLSEEYQVPVIILTDQYLNDSFFIVESFEVPSKIERFIVRDKDMEKPEDYRRFELSSSGISPRALPCAGEALVIVSSDEHREDGHITEQISHRVRMVDKRKAKISYMINEMNPPVTYYGDADFLILGWGSTYGAIRESVDRLRKAKLNIGALHFIDLWPFPVDTVVSLTEKCKAFFMVENNSTAQLGQLIRAQTGLVHAGAVLKYDGRPLFPSEIENGIKKFLEEK